MKSDFEMHLRKCRVGAESDGQQMSPANQMVASRDSDDRRINMSSPKCHGDTQDVATDEEDLEAQRL
jgi:hypothetical protein